MRWNRARTENVIHEAGLFQGKLGLTKAIVVLEGSDVREFSNIHGLGRDGISNGQYQSGVRRNTIGSRTRRDQSNPKRAIRSRATRKIATCDTPTCEKIDGCVLSDRKSRINRVRPFFRLGNDRLVLRAKILLRPANAVIVRSAIHGDRLLKVAVRRRRGSRPFESRRLPWIIVHFPAVFECSRRNSR